MCAGAYFAGFPCCPETPGPEGLALFRLPSVSFPYTILIIFCTGNTISTFRDLEIPPHPPKLRARCVLSIENEYRIRLLEVFRASPGF